MELSSPGRHRLSVSQASNTPVRRRQRAMPSPIVGLAAEGKENSCPEIAQLVGEMKLGEMEKPKEKVGFLAMQFS